MADKNLLEYLNELRARRDKLRDDCNQLIGAYEATQAIVAQLEALHLEQPVEAEIVERTSTSA